MNRVARYEYIVGLAEVPAKAPAKGWTNAEKAKFHYFNPNGLAEAKKKRDAEIRRLVNEFDLPSGVLLAYGSLNNFYTDTLMRLAGCNRVGTIRLMTTLDGLRRDIKMADEWIRENSPK